MANIQLCNYFNSRNPTDYEVILTDMCEYGDEEGAMEMVKSSPASEPSITSQLASRYGFYKVLEFLMNNPTVDPLLPDHTSFVEACKGGHASVVSRFLESNLVDPSHNGNEALLSAIMAGSKETVKMLLMDSRVDPSYPENLPLIVACETGRESIVRLLLLDLRVDPSHDKSAALIWACGKGHLSIVRALCDDPRVDVSTWHPSTYQWFYMEQENIPSARSRDVKTSLYVQWVDEKGTKSPSYGSSSEESCAGDLSFEEYTEFRQDQVDDMFCIEMDPVYEHSALQWAIRNCHQSVVRYLFIKHRSSMPCYQTALSFCNEGRETMLLLLADLYRPQDEVIKDLV